MVAAIESLGSAFQVASSRLLLSDSSRIKIGVERGGAVQEDHVYLVGRLLGLKAKFTGFKRTIPTIWRMKRGFSVSDAGDRFVFQFDELRKETDGSETPVVRVTESVLPQTADGSASGTPNSEKI
ncbi:hypothetical protein ACLB2K_012659 [Fragaria x ananassa]